MTEDQLSDHQLTRSIIGAFFEVYSNLGYGFLEHIYSSALERELRARGHEVAREVGVCVLYKGQQVGYQRLDLVVDGKVIVETKAGVKIPPTARRQLFNYLRCTSLRIGLLCHFGPMPDVKRLGYEPRRPVHWKPEGGEVLHVDLPDSADDRRRPMR